MIPRADVTDWRRSAPWPTDAQVEQDLVLSRALIELFSATGVAKALAFRGGTALNKLFFAEPERYSEDIDLVQREAGPIGPVFDAIRRRLDPWLGSARFAHGDGRATLVYRFATTSAPVQAMRLKVEINTREHLAMLGAHVVPLRVVSPWFAGEARVSTFVLEELLATKLRALYQRKKGRDLFDIARALERLDVDDAQVVACFDAYLSHAGQSVSRAEFEANLGSKLGDPRFTDDIRPLLADARSYDVERAGRLVRDRLLVRLHTPRRRQRGGER